MTTFRSGNYLTDYSNIVQESISMIEKVMTLSNRIELQFYSLIYLIGIVNSPREQYLGILMNTNEVQQMSYGKMIQIEWQSMNYAQFSLLIF